MSFSFSAELIPTLGLLESSLPAVGKSAISFHKVHTSCLKSSLLWRMKTTSQFFFPRILKGQS